MTFRILTHHNEVQHHLNEIRQAVDAQKTSLGFWPPSAYEQAASQERLWVAVDEETHYLGHILFGAARPSIKVFQISVQAESRRNGVAKELLSALEAHGEKNDYMSVLARVAIDLPANGFWERSGYPIVRQVEGEGRRTLNVRGKQLRVVSLFPDGLLTSISPPALQFAERPLFAGLNYVLDLNVIFDLKKHRPREQAARQLVKLALAGPYQLFVADEAVAELLRASIDPENDTVLSFVRDIPALPYVPMPEIEKTFATLTSILCLASDQLTANQRSDLLHLAQSIHHGIRGFITADGQLLRSSEAIHDRFGLEIISPFELVAEAPALTSYEASLKGGAFSIREITESDRHRVGDFLSFVGVPPALSTEALQPVIGGTRRIRRAAFADDTLIGYLSWDSSPNPSREVFFFADESHSIAARVVDTALNEIANALPIKRTLRIDLRVLSSQLICREAGRSNGYRETASPLPAAITSLCKIAYRGPLTPEDWPHFCVAFRELSGLTISSQLLPFGDFLNTGITIGKEGSVPVRMPLFDFETLLSPLIALAPRRTSVLVPIKFSYAESLLGLSSPQPSLLPKTEAALCLERAYFRSARLAAMFSRGDIVVFYVSKHRYGGKAAVACARVTSSVVTSSSNGGMQYSRQGVIEPATLKSLAGRNDRLHAFTFDSVTLFPNPIDLGTLRRSIVGSRTLVAPFRLNAEKTRKLFALAFGG